MKGELEKILENNHHLLYSEVADKILELRFEITASVYIEWIKHVGENEFSLGFSNWLYRKRIESGTECLTIGMFDKNSTY